MNAILSVSGLVKRYKNKTAVNGVSFTIDRGTCFGLLGPNGAGKTTTIEMMEGIIPPSAGEILYKGDKRGHSFTEETGIQFQHTELLSFLTVDETLKTFRGFYKNGLSVDEVRSLCMLDNIGGQYTNKISGGQKQRLLLGLALLNDPCLVFLDEPSTGLDPQARQHVWQIIKGIKKENKTIVLTTHYMDEARTLCDDIAIMDDGGIIQRGAPETLIEKHCSSMADRDRNLETVFLKLTGKRLRE